VLCAGVAVAPARAAVVVVHNRTSGVIEVAATSSAATVRSVAPQQVLPVELGTEPAITVRHAGQEQTYTAIPDSIVEVVAAGGALAIRPRPLVETHRVDLLPADAPSASPTVIPVRLLVSPSAAADEYGPVAAQIAAASRFFERWAGVRFEVTGTEASQMLAESHDLSRLWRTFRETLDAPPGELWIGLAPARANAIKNAIEGELRPLAGHLLLPLAGPHVAESDLQEYVLHGLGHYLGATHAADTQSIFRGTLRGQAAAAAGEIVVDPLNALILNLVGRQWATVGGGGLPALPAVTRRYLHVLYQQAARETPGDGWNVALARWSDEVRLPAGRYLAAWDDGAYHAGDVLGPWWNIDDQPRLDGQPLFTGPRRPAWICDRTSPQATLDAWVEFWGGDCLPGQVQATVAADPAQGAVQHFLVNASVALDRPGQPRTALRVLPRWVRRIVWQPLAPTFQPGTIWLRDGRQRAFRSVRFQDKALRVLGESGIEELPLATLAELHLPRVDLWDAWFEMLAVLAPHQSGQMLRVETTTGLRATTSTERFQVDRYPPDNDPARRYHVVQPCWSLDPLWLSFPQIRLWRWTAPTALPLSWQEPAIGRSGTTFSTAWPPQVDRNVQGGPLLVGGRLGLTGFGVHAPTELTFPLPPAVEAMQTRLGLDQRAGDGGCVRATIRLESAAPGAAPALLYHSPTLVGGGQLLDTGMLRLPAAEEPRRLVLAVQPTQDRRPPGADLLDVRGLFDWLDPVVVFQPQRLSVEVRARLARWVPAWSGWTIVEPPADLPQLANYWTAEANNQWRFRLAAAAHPQPLRLRRTLEVGPAADRLVIAVSRPTELAPSTIAVLVDGRQVQQFEVPAVARDQMPTPVTVSLAEFRGRPVNVDLVQRSTERRALVFWRRLEVVGSER